MSVRPTISSMRSVCATSSSRHISPLTTVMPSVSTSGDCRKTRIDCWSVVAGPRASWSMMTFRFDCAVSGEATAMTQKSPARKTFRRLVLMVGFSWEACFWPSVHDGARHRIEMEPAPHPALESSAFNKILTITEPTVWPLDSACHVICCQLPPFPVGAVRTNHTG